MRDRRRVKARIEVNDLVVVAILIIDEVVGFSVV